MSLATLVGMADASGTFGFHRTGGPPPVGVTLPRKLFIVARGNETDYNCLKASLAREEGTEVEIIFDRRAGKRRRWAWLLGRGHERRGNPEVQRQLRTRGWAVYVRAPRD